MPPLAWLSSKHVVPAGALADSRCLNQRLHEGPTRKAPNDVTWVTTNGAGKTAYNLVKRSALIGTDHPDSSNPSAVAGLQSLSIRIG